MKAKYAVATIVLVEGNILKSQDCILDIIYNSNENVEVRKVPIKDLDKGTYFNYDNYNFIKIVDEDEGITRAVNLETGNIQLWCV